MALTDQANRQEFQNRYELRNRYLFTGRLVMQTALHIGGGKITLCHSDSPIVLTPEEIPFIPGSSLKGALRSTVEKLVPMLPATAELRSCGLPTKDDETNRCPTARQSFVAKAKREREARQGAAGANIDEELENLCHTCQLFGSPFAAARISINDLYMPREEWSGAIQVRDGVAIDRDSEKARDRLKYDFEVVPASAVFNLEIQLENATQQDLQLICVGLSEFVHGFGVVGGKRSRGLGACQLDGLEVFALELTGDERDKRLRNYLLKREFSGKFTGQEFLEKYIATIFQ